MPVTKLRPSFAFTQERLEQLKQVVPEAFADGRVNWDVLREAMGEYLEDEGLVAEHFGLSWPGKRDARRLAARPSNGTLVPVPGEGLDEEITHNIFIQGDNLEVLKILQKSYAGRVKVIYIDPPYNTGNDFVYNDKFKDPLEDYLRKTGQTGTGGGLLTTNPQASGRFHTNWLSMMWPRLQAGKRLLRDDGVIFVSIDDHEVHNLRMLMNEVFGEENFMGALIWKRRQNVDSRAKTGLSIDHEYLVVYRNPEATRLRGQEKDLTKYSNPDNDPRGPWSSDNLVGLATKEQRPNLHYGLVNPATGIEYACPEAGWRYGKPTMARLIEDGRIIWPSSPSGRPRLRRYLNELADEFTGLSSVLEDDIYSSQGTKELKELFDGRDILDFPKPVGYIKMILQQATNADDGDIVMDFFAGSCTTAHAVLELNREDGATRRFVMVQLPEPTGNKDFPTVAEIGKERIRRAIARMKRQSEGTPRARGGEAGEDLGFKVFRLGKSNYVGWGEYDGAHLEEVESLFDRSVAPLSDGWMEHELTAEVMLLQGFPLDSRLTPQPQFKQNTVVLAESESSAHRLILCLDKRLADETMKTLAFQPGDIFVCLDSALTNEGKAQLADLCNLSVI